MKPFKLENIEKKQPYEVPEGYFDQLTADIISKTIDQKAGKVVPLRRNILFQSMAAAVILALISLPVFFYLQDVESPDLLSEVSNDDIMYYLDYYEVSEFELIDEITPDMELAPAYEGLPDDIDLDDEYLQDIYLEYGLEEI